MIGIELKGVTTLTIWSRTECAGARYAPVTKVDAA
jgi:hypothetical protein